MRPRRLRPRFRFLAPTRTLQITPPLLPAAPLFGIYIYDVSLGTQAPVVVPTEKIIYDNAVAGAARPLPPVIFGPRRRSRLSG